MQLLTGLFIDLFRPPGRHLHFPEHDLVPGCVEFADVAAVQKGFRFHRIRRQAFLLVFHRNADLLSAANVLRR
jgi:hypothetical protein